MRSRGLSVVEVLLAVGLIAVLAVVSLPMLSRANDQARSTACRANLTTLGGYLQVYHDAEGQLPVLMNRDSTALRVPTIDQLFALPVSERGVFHCPNDDSGTFLRSGTSYRWFSEWDGAVLGGDGPNPMGPVLADKSPFHHEDGSRFNALFPAGGLPAGDADTADPFLVASPLREPR